MRRIAVTVLTVLTAGVAVAGCSGSTSGGGSSALGRYDVTAPGPASPSAPSARSAPSEQNRAAAGSGAQPQQRQASPLVAGTAKIRTAQLSVTVRDRAAVAARADQAATLAEAAGGEVESEDRGRAYASLRLRVPPAALTATLRTLSSYGTPTSREVSVRDVTAQVADVTSRVRSAELAIARLRALYATATGVSDVIAVEQQLSSREADLESLQAQQRTLSAQTSLAAISLDLRAKAPSAAPPRSDERSGFVGGLADGWDAFVRAATGLATGLGAALPFVALLAVLLPAGRAVWRRTVSPRGLARRPGTDRSRPAS